jgi:RNA polymerase sigma-70 factor (ECF subfamily)
MSAAEPVLHRQVHTLYSEHHGWLQGWLRRRLGNTFDAADLAQDTFVRILVSPNPWPDHSPEKQGPHQEVQLSEPRAYLTLIAKRLMANLFRRRSLEHSYLEALGALPEAHAPSPEQQAIILETLQEIDTMLDGLAPKVRVAFLMAQLEGLGYAEIAERLDVSERTVKRYMAEALARCILLAA